MPTLEDKVAHHYAPGALMKKISEALAEAGADPRAPKPDDLKAVDEFHTGGLEATEALLEPLGVSKSMRVLDLGSGIGGTARFIALRYGAQVTGIDLTPEFVETASTLSARVGLSDATQFHVGSVLDLPLEDRSFDLVTMIHVGMNISDKRRLFAEAYRVLQPGGRFALFDIMLRDPDGEIAFPVPWASAAEGSFVELPEVYREAAASAGFEQVGERDQSGYAQAFFTRVMEATEAQGVPPVGLHLLMGSTAQEKYGNVAREVLDGTVGPWEMVFQRPG